MTDDTDTELNQEALNLACTGLETSVKQYIRKYANKNKLLRKSERESLEQEADEAVKHACHVLRQLSNKKSSLWHGIRQLTKSWNCEYLKYIEKLSEGSDPVRVGEYEKWLFPVLSRFFQHYLRLLDGTVLLTSGECRHVGDIPKNTKFPSRFSQLKNQSDGYTKIYSAPRGYSGFGWDEFFQETVGVQTRLTRALQRLSRKSRAWDYLLEHGAQSFESCLDMHEASMARAKGELKKLHQTFCSNLTQVLKNTGGGTVEMVTLDKMERLNIVINSKGSHKIKWGLERRADNFQVTDKGGVLPNGWTQQEWGRVMSLSAMNISAASIKSSGKQPLKKKRRIIDSDSDEEIERAAPLKKEGGLKVKQKTEKTSVSSSEASLNAIKMGFGVNAEELEAAREVVEAEQQTVKSSSQEEANQEHSELETEIAETREKIKSFRRVLKRAIEKNDDDYEVWDARECLRESIVTLGNLLLSRHVTLGANDKERISGSLLKKAEDLFREAVGLVEQQKADHETFSKQTNDLTKESFRIEQSLWLLHGRAYTNLGISLVEQGLQEKRKLHSNSLFDKGMKELKNAQECVKKLREALSCRDAGSAKASLDSIQAAQLDCLSSRWLATALWYQGRRADAESVFESAVGLFDSSSDYPPTVRTDDLLQAEILLGVECFYASTTFTEAASESLVQLPTASSVEQIGQDLFLMASRGYDFAKRTCVAVERLTLNSDSPFSFRDLQQQHSLMTPEDISRSEQELKEWWEQKKARATADKHIPVSDHDPTVPRSDLFTDAPLHSDTAAPKRCFVVSGDSSKPRSKRARGTGLSGVSAGSWRHRGPGTGTSSMANPSRQPKGLEATIFGGTSFRTKGRAKRTIQFRKWGDELLPDVPGKPGVKLSYPSCAPERPKESISSQ